MKEYIFLHNLVNEGIKTGEIKGLFPRIDHNDVLSGQQGIVSLILDSNVALDKDRLYREGFQIIWNGLTNK